MEIWKLQPACKDLLWGGYKLKNEYNIVSNDDKVAEGWMLSVHPDGTNIITSGRFEGKSLATVLQDRQYWGSKGEQFSFFPTMVKLIDAMDKLSIQVHPSDQLALRTEGQYGKTEVWYILEAEPDAYLYYGLNRDLSEEELREYLVQGKLEEVLNKVAVKPGDVLFVASGTIHAICKGIVLAEIQQNSNVTYRLYDYNRKDKNGNPRQLHIEKGLQAINLNKKEISTNPVYKHETAYGSETLIAEDKYFIAREYDIAGKMSLELTTESFTHLVVLDGSFTIEDVSLNKGETCFIPPIDQVVMVEGEGKLLVTGI